ncbi:invasion protein [Lichenibacterium minor]|jgi:invasion protein IalB|uniref:Invasion protein n=1 Tax=Lichenibacterium minor TaxID=2316528 RepID=A0A4Q2U8W8_9HYPH|nr:invasion associated locus B family protein [Lichenibacterium minor]RYC31601.1 invasion protein [Lichenibacterium minor]
MRHAAGAPAFTSSLATAVLASVILAAAPSSAASAQTAKPAAAPPAPAAPVSADPSVTTASYGDWTARCEKGAGEKAQRICEAVQTVQLPNQQVAVAQIAFGHAASAEPLKLVVVLPVDVWFPSTVRILAGDKDPAGVELAWRRCLPVGCFAESTGSDEAARRWRNENGQGRIVYKDGLNRDVTLPVSFRGLAQALDALGKM